MADILEMLSLSQPITDIAIRSVIGFVGLIALVRIVPKRNASRISPNDMLILIIIGTIGADAVTGGSYSVGDLLVMITIVLLLGYLFDVLEFRSSLFRRLMRHDATVLIREGKLLRNNMRGELVTEQELMSVLRMEGIKDVSQVSVAVLEADGEISVLRNDDDPENPVKSTLDNG